MLIQVANVAACKASKQTAQGSALGFNPAKKERPAGAKAFIYLTMLLPLQRLVHEDALEAVAAEDGVGLVDNLQGVELCTAFRVMRSGAGKDDEEEEDGTPSPHPVSLKVAGCARYADVWLVSLHDAKVRRKLERFFIFRS